MEILNAFFSIVKVAVEIPIAILIYFPALRWIFLLLIIMGVIEKIIIPYYKTKNEKKKIDERFEELSSWRSDREKLYKLRGYKPKEFEEYVGFLFSKLGYKTEVVGGSYDGGIDVIAEKNGIKHLIQCKKYFASHQVGVGAVRDFYGAMADKVSNGKGYLITTSKFTAEAERFAEDKPIELIDGFRLIDMIKEIND